MNNEELKVYKHNWYLSNKDRILDEQQAYRAAHPAYDRGCKRAYRANNKSHVQEQQKNWYENNKTRILKNRVVYFQVNKAVIVPKNKIYQKEHPIMRKKHGLKYNYGMTAEVYSKMLQAQNNCCKICGRAFAAEYIGEKKDQPHVDHNHVTNHIRGILCHSCNLALGFAKDNVDLLQRMVTYLQENA